ncbi:glycerate kinase [Listeria grandensis]|uniref:glycerate kinase n=1 Tax=Listeria grandensis TaxID=1494963 RepID=UPI00162A9E55|nr:glycerate kinase [Listeria grandensis]MBC1474343.1 glycerate kinase [Listeria grandensis]
MKIVIAPDSYKESLTAQEVAEAIQTGFVTVFPDADYQLLPVGDGGEGTIAILAQASGGVTEDVRVTGPLGEMVTAKMAFSADRTRAFIEMAEACGLHLVPAEKRDPLAMSTAGVGELVLHALDAKVSEIVIGVGGSATHDGGIGMAAALGARFYNLRGENVTAIGANLSAISSVSLTNLDPRLSKTTIRIAADVENPLCGENGAATIFGPQKGLPQDRIPHIDNAMHGFYSIFKQDVRDLPGSGAGGGMGAGLMLFAGAKFEPGIELVLRELRMKEVCADADIILVGEGRMDAQTVFGKAPIGVANCAPENATVIGICGSIGEGIDAVYSKIDAVFPTIATAGSLEDILPKTRENIERTARNVAVLLKGRVR